MLTALRSGLQAENSPGVQGGGETEQVQEGLLATQSSTRAVRPQEVSCAWIFLARSPKNNPRNSELFYNTFPIFLLNAGDDLKDGIISKNYSF